MNRIRRKRIDAIYNALADLQADLEAISDEEEEARDNIPESLWESERYEKADEACDNLDSAKDSLEELMDYLLAATE